MKRAILATSLLILAAPAMAAPVLIEYYGDSTVWGFASGSDGKQVAEPAPLVFARILDGRAEVRNRGVSGSTACALLAGQDGVHPPWEAQMRASKARYVILNHAINDQWKYGVAAYRDCLRKLAAIARAHGKEVVFETPNPTRDSGPGGLDVYVEAMRDVARNEGVPVIDQYAWLMQVFAGRDLQEFVPDGLHPSQRVYELKGRFAAQAFSRLFPGKF